MKQIESRNWNFNESSMAYIFAIVGYFCASIILTIVVIAVAGSLFGASQNADEILSQSWVSYLNIFLSEFMFLLVFLICNKKFKKQLFVANRVKVKPNIYIILGVIFGGAVLFFGSINSSTMLNELFQNFAKPMTDIAVPIDNFAQFLLATLMLAILPAVCEELLFRGVIFNGLKSKLKAHWAIIFSALLFALMHMSIYQTVHQFVLGVILATLAYYSGTIVYGMIFHFVNNFLVVFLTYLFPTYSFTFSSWGVWEVILSIAIFMVAIGICALLFYLLAKHNKKVARDTKSKNSMELRIDNTSQYKWQEIIAEGQQNCGLYELSSKIEDGENNNLEKSESLAKQQENNSYLSHNDSTLGIILYDISAVLCVLMWVINSF